MPITAAELEALVEAFPWDEWSRAHLEPGFRQIYRDLVESVGKGSTKQLGTAWQRKDPFTSQFMTDYVGERITQLQGTSKDRVIALVRRTLEEAKGLTPVELGKVIHEAVSDQFEEYGRWRANTVARTETAIATNHGTVLGVKQAGVAKVDVFDGTDDEECRAANGQVWTVEQALENPLGHPNCVRAFGPHVDDEE